MTDQDTPTAPIFSWVGNAHVIKIFRKDSLYGSEKVCELRTYSTTPKPGALQEIANAVCDFLQTRHETNAEEGR